MRNRVNGPGYYAIDPVTGRLTPTTRGDGDDVAIVICRRVADFPGGQAPIDARRLICAVCAAPLAADPLNPHIDDRPPICFQCFGIQPEPVPRSDS